MFLYMKMSKRYNVLDSMINYYFIKTSYVHDK